MGFVGNLLLFVAVKEFCKSIKNRQSCSSSEPALLQKSVKRYSTRAIFEGQNVPNPFSAPGIRCGATTIPIQTIYSRMENDIYPTPLL